MKKYRFVLILIFVFVLIVIFEGEIIVHASSNKCEKILCNATINDSFSEERILVVLNEENSYSSKEYNRNDFNINNCNEVRDLTSYSDNAKNLSETKLKAKKRVLSLELINSSKEYVLETINELIKREDVLYAGPDYKITLASTVSNDYYQDDQWAISSIMLPQAWEFTTGCNEIVVGIIDSGIDGTHPDLEDSILKNMCKDYVSQIYDYEPVDLEGHGTHVAGIIGAIGNNNIGVVGANWNVSLVSLRAFDSKGEGYSSNVADAILDAKNMGIPILNLSARWYGNSTYYDYALETIINDYSGLIVSIAGNESLNNDTHDLYPGNYCCSNLITVGSYNKDLERSKKSNYGENTVDIYAPGESILSTFPENFWSYEKEKYEQISRGYAKTSGTSMAAPYVSGVAALLLSLNNTLTPQQLKDAILNSAETITITLPDDTTQNVKKLNAFNAVKYVLENYVSTAYTVSNSIFETEINKTVVSGASYFNELNGLYKLNLTESKNYEFKLSSNSAIEFILYDEEFNEIECEDLDSYNNKIHVIKMLTSGKYYLRTKYANEASSGTINIDVISSRNYNVTLGNNDILLNTYNYDNDITHSNVYSMHINENEFGFYKFELVGYTSSGNEIGCPSASIVVKDSEQNIIDRIEYDGYVSQASNEENENSFVVSLKEEGYIYIYIEIDTSDLNYLYLNINSAEFEAIDLFGRYENYDEQINIIENESTYGDYFKKITLNQSARFFVELANFSDLDDKVLFVLSKLNYNSSNDSYSLENIVMELLTNDEREFTYFLDLTKGTYFVGYFNKDDSSLFNLTFTRIVSEFSTTKLVSDPDSLSLYGSEVRYNGGVLRGDTLTVGFTRILYIDYNLNVPSYSITSFDLFVSDSSVVTVSVYGTMLARRSGTVDVIAIYKNNPSIIYSKTFTVVEETRTDDLIINIDSELRYSESGQLYQVSLNDLNCPYPQNTLYGWSIVQSNYNLTISLYGSVILRGEDEIIIEGRYSLNPKVVIRITLIVI